MYILFFVWFSVSFVDKCIAVCGNMQMDHVLISLPNKYISISFIIVVWIELTNEMNFIKVSHHPPISTFYAQVNWFVWFIFLNQILIFCSWWNRIERLACKSMVQFYLAANSWERKRDDLFIYLFFFKKMTFFDKNKKLKLCCIDFEWICFCIN